MNWYRQCKLERGQSTQVAWIEERGAKQGNLVELKSDNHEKWKVAEVWSRVSEEYVRELERDFASQRRASDI